MSNRQVQWYLGASSLAMIMEQERKHWLLKTDKKKYVQDQTGDEFVGVVNNEGDHITIETEKLPIINPIVKYAAFDTISMTNVSTPTNAVLSNALEIQTSVFPYIPEMNGLLFARIKSINILDEEPFRHYNFSITFKNCEKILVPMTTASGDVYSFEWLKTSTTPELQMYAGETTYGDPIQVQFKQFSDDTGMNVTNPVFYYPLDAVLQPFPLTHDLSTYTTEIITNPDAIGLPLFWFGCDETDSGPSIHVNNNNTHFNNHSKLFKIGFNNVDKYQQLIYASTGDLYQNLPADKSAWDASDDIYIVCHPKEGTFQGNSSDFSKPLDFTKIRYSNRSSQTTDTFTLDFTLVGDNTLTMNNIYIDDQPVWVYNAEKSLYESKLSIWDCNAFYQETRNPLRALFKLSMDTNIKYGDDTTDTGYAGIHMNTSSSNASYPHDIQNMEGLPDWIRNQTSSHQNLSVYALHNTPNYDPSSQESRQIAGLIFDPGKERDYSQPMSTDERGRVYVLSNDETTYVNNARTDQPKPPRTLARICDIPTSVAQLVNIEGIAPTTVVDKKYVRSEAPFTTNDLYRLYNGVRDTWVRPIHLDKSGNPIYNNEHYTQPDEFVFNSYENLMAVDLLHHNDFRYYDNLNQKVPANQVRLAAISATGSNYQMNDVAVCIVGGYGFHIIVTEVNAAGGVVSAELSTPPGDQTPISLSNFDMADADMTVSYGTSPYSSSNGTGLKVIFQIMNYTSLLPKKTYIIPGLHAFVRHSDGIWLYKYDNTWIQLYRIAEQNDSEFVTKNDQNPSTRDALINAILPSVRELPTRQFTLYKRDSKITVLQTSSYVNVVDTKHTPVWIPSSSNPNQLIDDKQVIDINRFYCKVNTSDPSGNVFTANTHTFSGVKDKIKKEGLNYYDSYFVWKWLTSDPTELRFKLYIIRRSFNNLFSDDTTSKLPKNELYSKKFVHTNPGTTIVWNVPHIGPMMWMYQPFSRTYEKYYVNANTRDLYVDREPLDWNTVEVIDQNNQKVDLQFGDNNGNLKSEWNLFINHPEQVSTPPTSSVIYQQPDLSRVLPTDEKCLMGQWQLVFPEIHSFKFKNDNNQEIVPVKMTVIRGNRIAVDNNDILNEQDENVNYKTLVIDEDATTTRLKVYNPETGNWEYLT